MKTLNIITNKHY